MAMDYWWGSVPLFPSLIVSASHLMLFPYHLSDIIIRELRITPFNYYVQIIIVSWQAEIQNQLSE